MWYWDGLFFFDGERVITNFTGLFIFILATQLGSITLAMIIGWGLCGLKNKVKKLSARQDQMEDLAYLMVTRNNAILEHDTE